MEPYCRMAVGIIYFFQMAALTICYKKTNDKKILHDSDRETAFFVAIRSIWAFAVIASILLYVLFPVALKWGELDLNNTVRVIGMIIGIASDLLILWILVSLGKNISAALKVRDNQQLVTSGPYRYVRHPLYSAGLLLFFSIFLISANWLLGLIGIGFQLFLMLVRTPLEEQMLIEHFGEEYRRYMQQTGAHMPRFRGGMT